MTRKAPVPEVEYLSAEIPGAVSSIDILQLQFVPFATWANGVKGRGWKIDGATTKFWATKARAIAGAKAIGWPANSVVQVATRFQVGWALADGRFGTLSKDWYDANEPT